MKVRDICIRNFRSLQDITLTNLGNVNIFVGKNSSGKSNLLEALSLFFNDFSLIGGNTAGLNEYYWFNKKTESPIEFDVNIELSEKEIAKIFKPTVRDFVKKCSESLTTLQIKRRIATLQGAWETSILECSGACIIKDNKSVSPDDVMSGIAERYAQRTSEPTTIVPLSPNELNEIINAISAVVKNKFQLVTQIRDVQNPIAHRITLVDSKLQSSLWALDQSIKNEEEEKFQEVDSGFLYVTGKKLDPAQGQVYIRRQTRRIPLYLEGGGIQASLQLIFSLRNESDKYCLFGIEEPEAHLHSELQRKLFDELKHLSDDCQLFITTHSPTFVDRADLETVWISRFADGETTFEKTSELGEIVDELGIRPSDVLFFTNRILFVEGKSEEIVIPAFAEKLQVDLQDVAILPVEGKNKARLNLKTWVKITRGILPIFLLLDKDAKVEIEELVKEDLVKSGKYHVWQLGSIEHYYPLPSMKKALNELNKRYSLEMDVSSILNKIKSGELPPDKIDLGGKQELLDRTWEVLLAESIARLLREEKDVEIPEEVSTALKEAAAA